MSGAWNRGRLGDVCRVIPGYAFKSSDWQDEGIPVIKIKNISGDNSVDLTATDCVPHSLFTPRLQKFVIGDGDILVAMTGATAGKVGRVRTNRPLLLNQRVAKIVPVEAEPNFIWSVVSSQEYQEKFFYLADGAAQPNMSGGQIEAVEIPLPPLPIQRRIADILSAYDELIENSQRRIKILESMARALYREWFVHFRFPGHESVPRVPSPLGEIPQGWEVKKLGEISSYINRGIAPRYDEEGDSVVINQKCVRDQRLTLELARRQSKSIPSEKRVCFGDVLINSTGVGTLGRVAQVYEDLVNCTVDTHVTIARAGPNTDLDFYGCCLLGRQETFERLGIGATGQTELGRGSIADLDLVVPPHALQRRFGKIANGMRTAAEIHAKKVQNLRRTRDLLLPRLLSGQIDVGMADEELADARQPPKSTAPVRADHPTETESAEVPSPSAPASADAQSDQDSGASPKLDDVSREEVMIDIRRVFSEGGSRDREDALRDVAYSLGFKRLGARIEALISNEFSTAVRRGILIKDESGYRLGFRSYAECTRDSLKNDFESAMGRGWISREDAIRAFARWSGFARVGEVIDETARSLINGLIREGRIEADGPELIRRTKAD